MKQGHKGRGVAGSARAICAGSARGGGASRRVASSQRKVSRLVPRKNRADFGTGKQDSISWSFFSAGAPPAGGSASARERRILIINRDDSNNAHVV